jgi:hypothetical protein
MGEGKKALANRERFKRELPVDVYVEASRNQSAILKAQEKAYGTSGSIFRQNQAIDDANRALDKNNKTVDDKVKAHEHYQQNPFQKGRKKGY